MKTLTVLIKPASSICNLRCDYCFYFDVSKNRSTESFGQMDISIAEEIIRKALESAEESCTFMFQGGEPTLRGLSFFKYFCDTVKLYNTKGLSIAYTVQTNGILLDEDWAAFLLEENFLVGLSLDGPKTYHDENRKTPSGKGSYQKTIGAARILDRYGIPFNVLCVVTQNSARHSQSIYKHFIKNGMKYLQFIPCIDPIGGEETEFSLKPVRYGEFLNTIFDLWYDNLLKGNYISIRDIDNYINRIKGNRTEICTLNGRCTCQFVIESDGSVYPCDFYVTDEWNIGNIANHSFDELLSADRANLFVLSSLERGSECHKCEWEFICRGGCRRYWEPITDIGMVKNKYCDSYKMFFEHSYSRLEKAASLFR